MCYQLLWNRVGVLLQWPRTYIFLRKLHSPFPKTKFDPITSRCPAVFQTYLLRKLHSPFPKTSRTFSLSVPTYLSRFVEVLSVFVFNLIFLVIDKGFVSFWKLIKNSTNWSWSSFVMEVLFYIEMNGLKFFCRAI